MGKLSTIQKRENLNTVMVMDVKGNGNANHAYEIIRNDTGELLNKFSFQNGPRKVESSQHGILDGDLLEIVRHRLIGFQNGEFATKENENALKHIEEALMWMNRRVEDRIERDVLGTYNK